MVKKIKKRFQRGPKATVAIPLAMALTALYGARREGKEFRAQFDPIEGVRSALRLHLEQEVLIADRALSTAEYRSWGFKSRPARLAEMFSKTGVIPMGEATNRDDQEGPPRLALLPMVALVQERELEAFSQKLSEDLAELPRVTFQNAVSPTFQLIPSYDLLLYRPPCPAQGINHAIEELNGAMKEAFGQASVPFPGDFPLLPEDEIRLIPLKENCAKEM